MNEVIQTSWRMEMVALSYAISVLGAFVALTAARNIRGRQGLSLLNTLAAGLALGGIGVWSMHFTGMLALDLKMGSGYSLVETLISLVAAVGATSAALAFVAQRPDSLPRIVGAGALLGLGVAVMHYLGMYGMRFPGYFVWSYPVVALSVGMAMAAASAALWLAFRTRTLGLRVLAAAVMGVAVCSMHYTGMAAADYVCTSAAERYATPQGFGVISSMDLPSLIAVVAIGMALLIAMDQLMQRVAAAHPSQA